MHVDGLQMVLGGRKEGVVNLSDMHPKVSRRKGEVTQAQNLLHNYQLILDDSPRCLSRLPIYSGPQVPRCQIYPHSGSSIKV